MSINPINYNEKTAPPVPDFVQKMLGSTQRLDSLMTKLITTSSSQSLKRSSESIDLSTKKPRPEEVLSGDEIAFSLQLLQQQHLNDPDQMIAEIIRLFPELNVELKGPATALKALLTFIFEIQSSGAFVQQTRWTKTESHQVFSVEVLSQDRAFIEITRSEDDKAKHGGESKFGRIIGINKGSIERLVALKIKFNSAMTRPQAIKLRLDQTAKLKESGLSPQFAVGFPKESISYKTLDKQQLLTIFEDLGGDLLNSAQKENWDLKKTISAMTLAALSLAHLHQNGYIHRDVKPQNFLGKTLASGDLIVKIGDLNFLIKEEDAQKHSFAGTVDYMPPELYRAIMEDQKVFNSKTSDMYSFGKALFDMLEKRKLIDLGQETQLCSSLACEPNLSQLLTKHSSKLSEYSDKEKELQAAVVALGTLPQPADLNSEQFLAQRMATLGQLQAQNRYNQVEAVVFKTRLIGVLAAIMDQNKKTQNDPKRHIFGLIHDLMQESGQLRPTAQEATERLQNIQSFLA